MSQQFENQPDTSPEKKPETLSAASPAQPQFWKHGVIAGIAVFAGFSFLFSSLALRPGPDHLGDANAPSPSEILQYSSSLTSQYELIKRELGPAPEEKQPTREETGQFIKEMPDRFAEITAKLDAQSRSKDRNGETPQIPAKPRRVSPEEISNMAANARSEFKDVNAALGVSSSATNLASPPANAIPWSDIGSAKLSELSEAKRKMIATAAIAQTAAAFQKILPMEDAPGITLFAVEAARTVMHSRYRISKDIEPAGQNEAGRALRRRACLGATMDMTLRLGGQYEYVLYDAGGLIVDRFTITENSCA